MTALELEIDTNIAFVIPSSEQLCLAILQQQNPLDLLSIQFVSLVDLALNNVSTDENDYSIHKQSLNLPEKSIQKGMTTNFNVAIDKTFVNLYQAYKYAEEQLQANVGCLQVHIDYKQNHDHSNTLALCLAQLNLLAENTNDARSLIHDALSDSYETFVVNMN